MSRFDKLLNLALVLAWMMVFYRFGSIYLQPSASTEVIQTQVDEYAEPSAPPPVRMLGPRRMYTKSLHNHCCICRGAEVHQPFTAITRCAARCTHTVTAAGSLVSSLHPLQPTPTSIPGPQAMRPLVGKCFYAAQPVSTVLCLACDW